MYLRGAESVFLGWHHIDFAVVHHIDNGLLTPTVQPDFVCQVRRTDGLVAFAVNTVTGGADREFGFAYRRLE